MEGGESANSIALDNRNCSGFEENIVLSVKECFFEDEIRMILIKKTRNGKKVKYFSRGCTNFVDEKRVCDECDRWFMNLSGLPFVTADSSLKGDIESFLDVKLDVEKENVNDNIGENVKLEHQLKDESEFDTGKVKLEAEENDDGMMDLDEWAPEDVVVKKPKSLSKKKRRRIPPELKVPNGFICRYEGCGKIFPKRKGWLKHDKTHDAKKTCDICGMAVSKLKEHSKRVHGVGLWGSENDLEDSKNWQAGIMGFNAKLSERQRKYSEDKVEEGDIRGYPPGSYVCRWEECRKVFDKKKAYLKHIYLIHEGGNEKRKRKKICEICGALITANNMKQHVRTVHTHKHEKNFACEHCGKEFKYRSELTVHLTHHTGELNFTCTGCAKKFRRAAEARLCERGHRGIYNFSCNMCDYRTHKKHHLDRHLKSHLKSTPFTCPICGFKSGRKDNLKQHVEKRHASVGTPIKQLEEMYPDMYKQTESCEAAEIAKQEAIAEHRAKMEQEQKLNLELEENRNNLLHQTDDLLSQEDQQQLQQQVQQQQQQQQQQQLHQHHQMPQHQQQTMGLTAEELVTHDIKPLHFVHEEEQRKYVVPEQQRLVLPEQQRVVLTEQQRIVLPEQQRLVLPDQQRTVQTEQQRTVQPEQHRKLSMEYSNERMPMEHNERMIQDQRERMIHEQRERMAQEQRDRMVQEQRAEIERSRMMQDRMAQDRMLADQRERMVADQRERERLLAEQRERDRLIAEQRERDRLAQEMRDRMFAEHRDRMTTTNSLAEVWQRMRSLDQ